MMDIRMQIGDAAARVLAAHATPEALTRAEEGEWPSALWDDLMALGLGDALIAEERGGHGLGWSDLTNTFRALGWHACPAPVGEFIIARALLDAAGLDAPDGVIGLSTLAGPMTLPSDQDGNAALGAVVWGQKADHVVLDYSSGETGGRIALAKVAAFSPRRTISRVPHADLALEQVKLADVSSGPVLHAGALLRTLQIAGAAERVLGETVEYANTRIQFGRPIGKFQAIQQLIAELGNEVAAAKAVATAAADAIDRGKGDPVIAVAKARASSAAGRVAEIAHEVHAAIGVTLEFGLHHLTRRLWQWRDDFGNEFYWRRQLAQAAIDAGPNGLWSLILRASGGEDQE